MTTLPLSEVLAKCKSHNPGGPPIEIQGALAQEIVLIAHALAMLPELVAALERVLENYPRTVTASDPWILNAIDNARAVLSRAQNVPMP